MRAVRSVSANQRPSLRHRSQLEARGSLVRAVRPAHSERIIADVGNIWSMHMTRNDGIFASILNLGLLFLCNFK